MISYCHLLVRLSILIMQLFIDFLYEKSGELGLRSFGLGVKGPLSVLTCIQ